MTEPWDADAHWTKAALFINLALDTDVPRTDSERQLWGALALELLAKSALARISPLLIATPTEDGLSLLAAAGLTATAATFKAIPAKTLFTRCGHAFKPFNSQEALRIAENRNEYLHGATADFAPIPADAWWPRFWAQAQVLVHACDRSINDLVGDDRAPVVEGALQQNAQNIKNRLEMLMSRAQQQFDRYRQGVMNGRELNDWRRPRDLSVGGYSTTRECPACGSPEALLEGDEVLESTIQTEQVSEADFDTWVDLEIAPRHFSCDQCHLVLDSYELIDAAGLYEAIQAIGDIADFYEPDYGND